MLIMCYVVLCGVMRRCVLCVIVFDFWVVVCCSVLRYVSLLCVLYVGMLGCVLLCFVVC